MTSHNLGEGAATQLRPCPICGDGMRSEFIRGKGFGYRCSKDGVFSYEYMMGDKNGYERAKKELEDILDPWEDPTCAGPHLLPEHPDEDFPGETFRVLKDKEEKQFGEYRTRRLVLEAWERLHAQGLMPEAYDQRKEATER